MEIKLIKKINNTLLTYDNFINEINKAYDLMPKKYIKHKKHSKECVLTFLDIMNKEIKLPFLTFKLYEDGDAEIYIIPQRETNVELFIDFSGDIGDGKKYTTNVKVDGYYSVKNKENYPLHHKDHEFNYNQVEILNFIAVYLQ